MQYAYAARALGRFNGTYLAGRALPAYPWLGPPGALRGTLQAFGFVRDVVENPMTWQHPLLRAAFPTPVADRLLRLWDEHELLLAALDRLPQTLCHKDSFRRNMFAPRNAVGQQLVLIDWAYVGRGEIGLDIADLFGASYSTFGVEPTDLETFDATIFDSYVAGLREAGWQGDHRSRASGSPRLWPSSTPGCSSGSAIWPTSSAAPPGKQVPVSRSMPSYSTRPDWSPTCSIVRTRPTTCCA
jgi:hypothetical protein